jgi:hypothetical protein
MKGTRNVCPRVKRTFHYKKSSVVILLSYKGVSPVVSKDLACAKDLSILCVAGWYKQPVKYGRESAHKSRAREAPSSLVVYMYANQHISKEENETISGS